MKPEIYFYQESVKQLTLEGPAKNSASFNNKYVDGRTILQKSADGCVIIPLSYLNDGTYYSSIAFVSDEGYISKIYSVNVPSGYSIDDLVDYIFYSEGIGQQYEATRQIVKNIYGEDAIYRYMPHIDEFDERTYGGTKRGKSRSDRYHNQFLQNRARDAAKSEGAKFTVDKNGHLT